MHFCTGAEEQKAANLRSNPHVLLTTGCTWDTGLDVVIEGDAIQITDHDVLKRLAQLWTTKWDGRFQFQVGEGVFQYPEAGPAFVFAVKPTKVFAFATGTTSSHTRHQF